jgi:DNA helicase-2/ATP-dependent DNA helicase PcrA
MPISAPDLTGDAKAARDYRGGHLQIIAAAGSGKTEVVAQRVAGLLADGVPAEGIVAFTFTERAAASLKSRIERRIVSHPGLGASMLDRIGGMFVGTIHSYCFRILQQHVPRYETFDVLDDNRLTAFLTREVNRTGIKELDVSARTSWTTPCARSTSATAPRSKTTDSSLTARWSTAPLANSGGPRFSPPSTGRSAI